MDGTVNILEVQIGTAVYRACAEECPPAGVDRRRYLDERHAEARRVEREIGKIDRRIIGAAHSMADFNQKLLSLSLGITAAMHVEGGPEASLSIHAGGIDLDLNGSFETGFNEDETQLRQWPIPNVLAIRRR